MEIYKIKDLTFSYPSHDKSTLADVCLSVGRGEFITVCGPSGCGKTTFLRQLKPSVAPFGLKSGGIFFNGVPLEELDRRVAAAKIGFVMQSPDNQIVTDKVWHELAFGLESLGVKTPDIRLRVAEMASFFGIQTWFHKQVTELSGGQKQMLALASIMVLQPSALILDEPTSQLDPIAAGEFLATVGKINRELGVTVILTEQRLEEAFPLSTRAVVMDGGRIIADGEPREVGLSLRGENHSMFLAMPTPMRIWAAVSYPAAGAGGVAGRYGADRAADYDGVPITVRDGAKWLASLMTATTGTAEPGAPGAENRGADKKDAYNVLQTAPNKDHPVAITIDEIWFRYDSNLPDVVKGLSFEARYGEVTAILGGNGTGKTTTLSLIAGLFAPYRGTVAADAKVYTLPQNPQLLFVEKTVRERTCWRYCPSKKSPGMKS